jgi:hypothetical protein
MEWCRGVGWTGNGPFIVFVVVVVVVAVVVRWGGRAIAQDVVEWRMVMDKRMIRMM